MDNFEFNRVSDFYFISFDEFVDRDKNVFDFIDIVCAVLDMLDIDGIFFDEESKRIMLFDRGAFSHEKKEEGFEIIILGDTSEDSDTISNEDIVEEGKEEKDSPKKELDEEPGQKSDDNIPKIVTVAKK